MKKVSNPPPQSPKPNEFVQPTNGAEVKYVRTQTYPSTSRNLVEQIATVSCSQFGGDVTHVKREYNKAGSAMGRKHSVKDRGLKRQPSTLTSDKKTRWLLTRKTWKYMADAGRKLIPEGVQNKPENIEKIEEHFQKLCQNEKKFLIWKRKLSYPGASGSFRRKNKSKGVRRPFTAGSPGTGSSADECEDDRPRGKGTDDLIIKMLEKYLNINCDIDERESEQQKMAYATAAAASSSSTAIVSTTREVNNKKKFEDEPSTGGSLAQRRIYGRSTFASQHADAGASISSSASRSQSLAGFGRDRNERLHSEAIDLPLLDVTKSNIQDQSIWAPVPGIEAIHSSLLLDSLKQYSKKNYSPYLDSNEISEDLLQDKALLRKILNDIRTQQKYSRTIPRTESTRSLNINYSSSMLSLTSTISSTFHNFVDFIDTKTSRCRNVSKVGGDRDSGKDYRYNSEGGYRLPSSTSSSFSVASSMPSSVYTSTSALSKPHQIYNQQKQIFANQQQQQMYQHQTQYPSLRSTRTISTTLKTITKTTSTTTVSASKQSSNDYSSPSSPISPPGILKNFPRKPVKTFRSFETQTDGIPFTELNMLFTEYKKQVEIERQEDEDLQPDGGRGSRKPSIDNKDVSQSVSDTIKRYLNMARKKPKDNDAANRFKRVNYDRNLRNIKAKGETTKPGDDDGLMKGCQTDCDWLEVLFSNPGELNRCCTSPIITPATSPLSISPPSSSVSPPPSPSSGIIQSSTQFLSNLFYHNNPPSHSPTPSNSSASTVIATKSGAMQKSKSSSNVRTGLMSKKIFRSRSKSQTRTQPSQAQLMPSSSDVKPNWTPQGNGVWVTNNGKRVELRDVFLPNLTEVERVVLEKQAKEKIAQLGITLATQDSTAQSAQKPLKRRVLLLKRKAVTTGIFDSKGKDDYLSKGGLVFNLPLEQCIENDHIRTKEKNDTRSSRSSLSSLLDHQQRDNSGSCESLPAKTDAEYLHNTFLPLFHTNIDRRSSQDDLNSSNIPGVNNPVQQVPSIVLACTKHLEENGLHTVGIFRVSTSKKRVRQLREDFDKGGITSLSPEICPHDMATLLKEFFRDLPEPLLCRHLYKAFLQTQSIRNRRLQLEGISHMIHLLPVAHRDTLYVLLKFLAKVATTSNDTKTTDGQVLTTGNKMDSINLATIFAPNILHCIKSEQFEEEEMAERSDVINIVRIMIDHFEELFIVNSEDMNEIYTTMMDIYPPQLDCLLDQLCNRQEEDIDSGACASVPVSPPFNQLHHPTFSDGDKVFSSSTNYMISTNDMQMKKVVYSREDILHENAAKGGVHSARRNLKDRDIRAKMKYQDPEKPLRRRRQSDRTESGDLSSSSSTHESYQHSSGISVGGDRDFYIHTISSTDANKTRSSSIDSNASDVFESVTRRMSSPLQSSHHASGVVTASLKIPVQTSSPVKGISSSIPGQNIHFFIHEKPGYNVDTTDIPYIEDSLSSFEAVEENRARIAAHRNSIQNSILLERRRNEQQMSSQRAQPVTITSKCLDEVQKVNTPRPAAGDKHPSKLTLNLKDQPQTVPVELGTKFSLKKSPSDSRHVSTSKIQTSASTGHIQMPSSSSSSSTLKTVRESNYTPSISSIGSVLLRSKTADFERIMSDQTKVLKSTRHIQDKPQAPPNPSVTNVASLKTTSTKKKIASDEVEKRMPIYKRQEIISSVQKTLKK